MAARIVPIFLLAAYLLFLLPGDASARKPTSTKRKCNRGHPLTSSDVKLEIFSESTLRGSNPVGTKLSCSSSQPLRGPTKLVMHGFISDGESLKKEGFVEAYKGKGANLIIVDWSGLAFIGNKRLYITAAACALEVGRYLAKCLNNIDVDGSNLHLFGHSLGAHGVGMAGRELAKLDRKPSPVTGKAKLSRTPSRVTGMDPAGPGFTRSTIADLALVTYFRTEIIDDLRKMKIGKDSGLFVDIVHTNPGEFGSKERLGHVDYYVNGVNGDSISTRLQPRCSRLLGKDAKDSHSYAVKVVVASLRKKRGEILLYGKDRSNAKSHFNVDQQIKDIPDGSYYLETNIEC